MALTARLQMPPFALRLLHSGASAVELEDTTALLAIRIHVEVSDEGGEGTTASRGHTRTRGSRGSFTFGGIGEDYVQVKAKRGRDTVVGHGELGRKQTSSDGSRTSAGQHSGSRGGGSRSSGRPKGATDRRVLRFQDQVDESAGKSSHRQRGRDGRSVQRQEVQRGTHRRGQSTASSDSDWVGNRSDESDKEGGRLPGSDNSADSSVAVGGTARRDTRKELRQRAALGAPDGHRASKRTGKQAPSSRDPVSTGALQLASRDADQQALAGNGSFRVSGNVSSARQAELNR